MAIDKPSLNDFLPNGFETQDKDGYKVNFDADKISAGYDKDTLEILSGPNLNNLLDNVGKNTHTLQQFLNFFKDMPIGSFPVVNTSNQLDYKSVNSFFRNVGELVFSAIPLEDGNLRLLDGSLLEYTMTYSRFITYIAGLRASLPNLFCTEQEFNQSVATYGVCGKFVYDTVTKSLRLPKISGFIKGTLDSGSLGDVDEAKAPNITGSFQPYMHTSRDGTAGGTYEFFIANNFDNNAVSNGAGGINGSHRTGEALMNIDASRSSSVYKNGVTTIEPQAIKEFIYMVVSIDEAEKQVLSAVYNYKGSVPTYADLPTAVAIGEVYNVIGEDPEGYSGANFAWTGEEWDRLGGTVNLSGYLTKTEAGNTYATKGSLESNVDYLQEQINTNATNIANIASQEVIDAGIQKIEMLKFASTLGMGKVVDTDLYSVIKKYKYSSFDRSKFTVVGSPIITDDGIVNTLGSASNGISFDISSLSSATTWAITSPEIVFFDLSINRNAVFGTYSTSYNGIFLYINMNKITWGVASSSSASIFDLSINDFIIETNKKYIFKITWDGSVYKLFVSVNGQNYQMLDSFTSSTAIYTNGTQALFYKTGSTTFKLLGTADLKQLSTTANGISTFSGNKTGIDTIKPSDYQVVGAPTISADGVASGFGSSNYINTGYTLPSSCKSYREVIEVITGDDITSRQLIRGSNANESASPNNYTNNIFIDSGKLLFRITTTGTSWDITGGISINTNTKYTIEVNWDGARCNLYLYTNGVKTTINSLISSNFFIQNTLYIGNSAWFSFDSPFLGKINLNSYKIYIDGNLVYQPCLKIPFHLSNTGLKVTDKLDRAIDIAEQCGFSDYFGLDEDNLLCLVPQGDNITGRRELISRVEDSVTHYVTEIYSDLYCRQMGSGTASTAVTLNIPYKDANYKLSVPQSAKSKTGFTPTASCDWTAEGYIYLDEVI